MTKEELKLIKRLKIKVDKNLLAKDASDNDYCIIGYNSAISDVIFYLTKENEK